jgi:hypothetical protein
MQVADVVINNIGAPGWVFQVILLVLCIGFPLALVSISKTNAIFT